MLSSCSEKGHRERPIFPVRLWGALIFLFVLPAVGSASAQDVQVPFDGDSTLYVIEPDLRDRLDLFPDVSGFQEATLYQLDDTTYELVVQYRESGRTRRDRRTLTAAEVESLRRRVSEAVSTGSQEPEFTQAGRYDLIAAPTIHGFWEGGLIAVATGASGDDFGALTGLGGTIGFFIPLLATREARVTEAEADMAFYGGLQGYGHALQTTLLIGGGRGVGRTTAAFAAVAGAAEGTVAYRIARENNWSPGHGEMVLFNGLGGNYVGFGVGLGIAGSDVGGIFDGDRGPFRLVAGTSLLGSIGGAYLGHRMGRTDRYTEGDARLYVLTSLQGVNLMSSFLSLGDPSVRGVSLLLTGTAVGGAVLGRQLVRDHDFTGNQTALIALGSLAGTLSGSALSSLADIDSAIPQALGSTAGFGLTYAVIEEDARDEASKQASAVDLDVSVAPTMASGPGMGNSNDLVPQVSLRATF
jgi:hypothetical protein